jgi:hypothetical protein
MNDVERALARLSASPRRQDHPLAWKIGNLIGHVIFALLSGLFIFWLYRTVT